MLVLRVQCLSDACFKVKKRESFWFDIEKSIHSTLTFAILAKDNVLLRGSELL